MNLKMEIMVFSIIREVCKMDIEECRDIDFKNVVCPDCGNRDKKNFDIIIDFGEEIKEVKFGCKICFEMFIYTYDELDED